MFIQTEHTPNPETLKFLPGRVVMKKGTAFFQKSQKGNPNSPFAKSLFEIDGVEGVFFGSDFITITKNKNATWDIIKPEILGSIMGYYENSEETIVSDEIDQNKDSLKSNEEDSEIVKQIKELIDSRVRPAVAMDGGDIVYESFKD